MTHIPYIYWTNKIAKNTKTIRYVCHRPNRCQNIPFLLLFFSRDEIAIIRKMCALRAGVLALRFTSITIATLFSVITFVLTEETLTPFNVFVLISFNNMLCTYLGFALLEGSKLMPRLLEFKNFSFWRISESLQAIVQAKKKLCLIKTHLWWRGVQKIPSGAQANGSTRLLHSSRYRVLHTYK